MYRSMQALLAFLAFRALLAFRTSLAFRSLLAFLGGSVAEFASPSKELEFSVRIPLPSTSGIGSTIASSHSSLLLSSNDWSWKTGRSRMSVSGSSGTFSRSTALSVGLASLRPPEVRNMDMINKTEKTPAVSYKVNTWKSHLWNLLVAAGSHSVSLYQGACIC